MIEKYAVSLLCTYALHDTDDHIPNGLLDLHSLYVAKMLRVRTSQQFVHWSDA